MHLYNSVAINYARLIPGVAPVTAAALKAV
jgi:hypothetical protein